MDEVVRANSPVVFCVGPKTISRASSSQKHPPLQPTRPYSADMVDNEVQQAAVSLPSQHSPRLSLICEVSVSALKTKVPLANLLLAAAQVRMAPTS